MCMVASKCWFCLLGYLGVDFRIGPVLIKFSWIVVLRRDDHSPELTHGTLKTGYIAVVGWDVSVGWVEVEVVYAVQCTCKVLRVWGADDLLSTA